METESILFESCWKNPDSLIVFKNWYKRRERGVHPKNFSSPGVRTVMGGTKRNHARCTERNFPPFSRLNWSLGKVAVFLVIYIFAAYKSTGARPLLLKRGRVKRGSNGRPLNFCINFYALREDMVAGSSFDCGNAISSRYPSAYSSIPSIEVYTIFQFLVDK